MEKIAANGSIKKLSENVINRIAAGEVVERASSAVKELIENSVDANSTQITVMIKGGGLKHLSVKDNGKGIDHADLPIVCERFTTSKLVEVNDLLSISTYGFRGEALASLTHVGKVSIVTKTKDNDFGYKARYIDGKLIQKPVPCASTEGTTIMVEELFYNIPLRKTALAKESVEYKRVVEVVKRYAIHLAKKNVDDSGVSFICKNLGSTSPDVTTTNNPLQRDAIGQLFGQTLKTDLIEIQEKMECLVDIEKLEISPSEKKSELSDTPSLKQVNWFLNGYISGPNYSRRKSEFILFINERLVTCRKLLKIIELTYSDIVKKGHFPFIYLSLHLPQYHVDVNVHPNKSEVCFLFENEILQFIGETISAKLRSSGEARIFKQIPVRMAPSNIMNCVPPSQEESGKEKTVIKASQTELIVCSSSVVPGENSLSTNASTLKSDSTKRKAIESTPKPYRPEKLVRTDHTSKRLDQIAGWENVANPSAAISKVINQESQKKNTPKRFSSEIVRNDESVANLSSVKELLREIDLRQCKPLKALLKELVYVGIVDNNYFLGQFKTGLYLIDFVEFSKEFFYQTMLRNFGKLRCQPFAQPLSVRMLLLAFLNSTVGQLELGKATCSEDNTSEIASKFCEVLAEKRDMLEDYFSIRLVLQQEEDFNSIELIGLPELLEDYVVQPAGLPVFLYKLSTQVLWATEKQCFKTCAFEIAEYFSLFPRLPKNYKSVNEDTQPTQDDTKQGKKTRADHS